MRDGISRLWTRDILQTRHIQVWGINVWRHSEISARPHVYGLVHVVDASKAAAK